MENYYRLCLKLIIFVRKKNFKIDIFDFMVYFVMFRCFICVYVKYYLLGVVVM